MRTNQVAPRFQVLLRIACLALFLSNALHAADAPSLDVYGKLPAFEMAALSFSGERIAVLGWLNNKRHVLIIGNDNKLQRTFTIGDLKVNSLNWAGDDLLLVEYRNTATLGSGFTADKTELSWVTVMSIKDGGYRDVFKKARMVAGGIQGFYGLVERAGRWYGYFGGITLDKSEDPGNAGGFLHSTKPALYEVDLQSQEAKPIAKRAEIYDEWRTWAVDAEGKVASTFEYFSKKGDWKLRNAERDVILTGQNPQGGVNLLGLGRTADSILYRREVEESGEIRYYEVSQAGGAPVELLPDIAVLGRYKDKLSRTLIGYETDEDYPQARFFDERKNAIMKAVAKAFPNRHMRLVDWNRDYSRFIVTTDGSGDPGTWWFVDIKTGSAIPLGASYLVPRAYVGEVRMVSYKAADGLELEGVLTLPPNKEAKSLPLIMFPHGGPAARDYPEFNWWAQAFAVQGYAVFQPNFRGSTGYSTSFRLAGHGEWGRKMQTDISDGLAELVKQGIVDPKRACIMGASYGGYASLAGVTLQQGVYRCAVSVAGVSDVKEMYQTEMRESGQNQTWMRSLRETLGEFKNFDDISPINFATRAESPILLIHGKDDIVVQYSQSKDMEEALRNAGKSVELVTLKGEDHWLSKSETRLEMLKRASEFIRKHNPPD